MCRYEGKGAATRKWHPRSSPLLPWQLGHPWELPSPSPGPFPVALGQTSKFTMDQESGKYTPSVSFLRCTVIHLSTSAIKWVVCSPHCLNSAFTYPFLSYPPSCRQMLSLASCVRLNSAPTRPAPTSSAAGRSWTWPLPTPFLPGLGSACPLAPTPSQRGQTKGLHLAVASHLPIYTVFLS